VSYLCNEKSGDMLESFFAVCLLIVVLYFFSPFEVKLDEEEEW
jgi:hypothetical protein